MGEVSFAERLAARLELEIGSRVNVTDDGLGLEAAGPEGGERSIRIGLGSFIAMEKSGASLNEIVGMIAQSLNFVNSCKPFTSDDWPDVKPRLRMHLVSGQMSLDAVIGGTISDSLSFAVAADFPSHLRYLVDEDVPRLGVSVKEIIEAATAGTMGSIPKWDWVERDGHRIVQFEGPEAADWAMMVAIQQTEAMIATPFTEIAWVVPESDQQAAVALAKVSVTATVQGVGMHALTPDLHLFRSGELAGQVKVLVHGVGGGDDGDS